MPKLILARHGVTSYNEQGIWTGLTDVDMSEKGYEEVQRSAEIVARFAIDVAFTSRLQRARSTAQVVISSQSEDGKHILLLETAALNEKDYGKFTGQNKQAVRDRVPEEVYLGIRRSWDASIPTVETLKMIHARVMPLHYGVVIPTLDSGRNVFVASHNNTLRAYVKELEHIPPDNIASLELGTAEIRIYDYQAPDFNLIEKHSIGEVH